MNWKPPSPTTEPISTAGRSSPATAPSGELAAAIERITGERVLPQGSGRTDAGVHARAQVASCELTAPIPAENLPRALNRTLPSAIRVLAAEHAPPDFHARHSVLAKTYEYRIYRGEICPPWTARYVYALPSASGCGKDAPRRRPCPGRARLHILRRHRSDLTARQSEADAPPNNIRTIFSSAWTEADDLLIYTVRGNGFLHHMVRNLVGTFLDAGRGHIAPEDITMVLQQMPPPPERPRQRGLFLHSVEY